MTLAPSVLSHFDELYPEFKDNIKDMTERTMMKVWVQVSQTCTSIYQKLEPAYCLT